jgi:hypothetical protein
MTTKLYLVRTSVSSFLLVNYDTEYDKLRRIILSIINDISNHPESTLQRILY